MPVQNGITRVETTFLKFIPPPKKKIILLHLKNEPAISNDFENFTPL